MGILIPTKMLGKVVGKPANNFFPLIRAFVSPGLMFTGQEAGLVKHIFFARYFEKPSAKFMFFCLKLNIIN